MMKCRQEKSSLQDASLLLCISRKQLVAEHPHAPRIPHGRNPPPDGKARAGGAYRRATSVSSMAALKNAKHEAFAQGLAKGLSASEAYVAAGYKESRSAASRLSTNVNVEARVAELSNRIAVKAEWTAADRLAALKRISEAAEAEDPRVAVSAISEANKMQGSHAPAKMDHLSSDGSMTPKPALDVSKLSTAALAEIMAAADEADKDGPAGN